MNSRSDKNKKPVRLLAVASRGGHWVQLRRLSTAFVGCDVAYVSNEKGLSADVAPDPLYVIRDANRKDKLGLIWQLLQILVIIIRVRPHVMITTGASPGYFAVRIGRLLGARTIWIDSIANAEELSMSGNMAGKHADAWLTQWQHLARADGPEFHGRVL